MGLEFGRSFSFTLSIRFSFIAFYFIEMTAIKNPCHPDRKNRLGETMNACIAHSNVIKLPISPPQTMMCLVFDAMWIFPILMYFRSNLYVNRLNIWQIKDTRKMYLARPAFWCSSALACPLSLPTTTNSFDKRNSNGIMLLRKLPNLFSCQ